MQTLEQPGATPQGWSVDIVESGPSGTITYREPGHSLGCYWEFGGGETLAIVSVDSQATWDKNHPWTRGRRAEILHRIASEVLRQKAPSHAAQIDDAGGFILIVPRTGKPAIVPPPRPRPPQTFLHSKQRIMGIIAIAVLALGTVAVGAKSLLSIRSSHGSPMGDSVRTPEGIATLIQTLEPYLPSLHRNPEKDRYRIALHHQPLSESAKPRIIPIARGVQAREFAWTRILGSDGKYVWCNVQGLVGVNIATGELIDADDLRKANPGHNEDWNDPRRLSCSDQLRASTTDRSIVLVVDPNTLQVSRSPAPKLSGRLPFDPKPEHFLAFAVRPASNQWLSLLSPVQAAGSFKPGSRLSLADRAESVREPRRLHRGILGPELGRGYREIVSLTPASDRTFANAAFIRTDVDAAPVRLTAPDGFLVAYSSDTNTQALLKVARVDTNGTVVWDAETGLDRFQLRQILPDARCIAFVGTRLPVPNKVSEPLLVRIDTATGKVITTSLWQ
jgi:hypothetical protein